MALKKATKAAAVLVGVAFVGLQTLQHFGYISIDYHRIQNDAHKLADVNGDGKVDAQDMFSLWDKLQEVLVVQLPQAGSFTTGFFLGFYYC